VTFNDDRPTGVIMRSISTINRRFGAPGKIVRTIPSVFEVPTMVLTAFGAVRLIEGDRSTGLQEIGTGVITAIVLTLWAVRHPGHRWWRWRNR
jgi:hypothetical protein